MKKYIDLYLETYSVSEILRQYGDEINRRSLEKILKDANVYEGLNGPNYLAMKVAKQKEYMLNTYGVENWGQISGGYKIINARDKDTISYLDHEYKAYAKEVDKATKKTVKTTFGKTFPTHCFYTDILFADEEKEPNPNDVRKRSIDHKIPKIICYLNGISAEEAGNIDNVIFVLKYVNSIKGNTLHDSFIPIAQKIRKVFLDEGYSSK
jgi:hypothetical protein